MIMVSRAIADPILLRVLDGNRRFKASIKFSYAKENTNTGLTGSGT